MMDAYTDQSHLEVTWVCQSLYSGPLSNPDFFLSLRGGRIRQVVLYAKIRFSHVELRCSIFSEPWFDMYLKDRRPVSLNHNPFITFTDDPNPKYMNQVSISSTSQEYLLQGFQQGPTGLYRHRIWLEV